ncbi:ATP-binding protein, partial [Enterococcus pseudoavium]|nr:ATP-binding protein [Enterococcus pseudoavium]
MESLGRAMQKIIDRVFITVGSCPDCGAEMYQWREKLPSGEDRCGPTCMICGHKELKRKQDYDTQVMYNESLKKRALNYFKYSSIVPDKTLFDKRMKGYTVTDQETKNALEIAKRAVNEFILGKPVHVVFTGKSG